MDVAVSCIPNYSSPGSVTHIKLLKWLIDTQAKDTVIAIRNESDKRKRDKLKAKLPAITPSGIFKYASEDGLIKHSGLIQFDIDGKDHLHIGNMDTLGEQLKNIENVAYCGLSVSGRGWWGLIPITTPKKHKAHFDALRLDFQSLGITIDDKCGNVKTLRGYSYDPNGYFNHSAIPYDKTYLPAPKPRKAPKPEFRQSAGSTDLDEIQNRVSVSEVVHYLSGDNSEKELRTGGKKMACPCPDTRAGSQRFTVWPDKQTFYCHKCGMGKGIAGVFKLVQNAQDVTFSEAKNFLVDTFTPDLKSQGIETACKTRLIPEGWDRTPEGELIDSDGLPVLTWWTEDDISAASPIEQKAVIQERTRVANLKSRTDAK